MLLALELEGRSEEGQRRRAPRARRDRRDRYRPGARLHGRLHAPGLARPGLRSRLPGRLLRPAPRRSADLQLERARVRGPPAHPVSVSWAPPKGSWRVLHPHRRRHRRPRPERTRLQRVGGRSLLLRGEEPLGRAPVGQLRAHPEDDVLKSALRPQTGPELTRLPREPGQLALDRGRHLLDIVDGLEQRADVPGVLRAAGMKLEEDEARWACDRQ
jgi:hypothetical protein